jgi:multidrug efflux pump subunit AcrA (membrane-fusion protein)
MAGALGGVDDVNPAERQFAEVSHGELVVRSVHEGRLASRHVVTVASRFEGPATIVSLTDEGVQVEAGDLLVRFDTSVMERELREQRNSEAAAEAELQQLVEARHPMEILELEEEIAETDRALAAASRYLADSRELAEDQLVSPVEIAEQESKVEGLSDRLAGLRTRLELTREHLHPLAVRRAEAAMVNAREDLEWTRRQIAASAIYASTAGAVVHQPLHVGGEYRTVRVGDTVFANQPFLVILDFSDLVVDIAIPEEDLSCVQPGYPAVLQPAAFPEIRLEGTVEKVSDIAKPLPDRPRSQRFFRATIAVRESDSRLRPGMSVVVQVVSHQALEALRIPRRAVRFDGDRATAVVVDGGRKVRREIVLGKASENHFEVLAGVDAGERVVLK